MKRVLLTGFEPFGEFEENPSEDIAKALDGEKINGCNIYGRVIPFDSRDFSRYFSSLLRETRPQLVLMMGQTFRTSQTSVFLEERASNFVDYNANDLKDNRGYQPLKGKIIPCAPDNLHTNILSLGQLVHEIRNKSFPVQTSAVTGCNFCNETYFQALSKAQQFSYLALFAHLPCYPNQTGGKGGLALDTQKKTIYEVINELTKTITPTVRLRNWVANTRKYDFAGRNFGDRGMGDVLSVFGGLAGLTYGLFFEQGDLSYFISGVLAGKIIGEGIERVIYED